MKPPRALLVAALCCAAAAWLAGPVGRLLVVLPLLLFGPGYLIERALGPIARPSAFLRPALWLGLSLSLIALLYEWITVLGLALAGPVLAVLAGACGLGVLWCVWRDAMTDDRRPTTDWKMEKRASILHPPYSILGQLWSVVGGRWSVGLLAILALTLWTRVVQIRDLALPAWVDSIHHALMIRVAAERGLAPLSLRPYLPIDRLPYHWGYHVFVATTIRLADVPLGPAMLWTGQTLNALHVLSAAALATYLWRRPTAGLVAALVVGLLSIMPAYYVSWGRYTQLTGLLLLPPLVIVWMEGLRSPSPRRSAVLALLLAGLSLIHFIVLVFALCFMAVSALVWGATACPAALRLRMWHAAAAGGAAFALTAPWIASLVERALLPAVVQPQRVIGGGAFNAVDSELLWAGHNRWLVALALAVALWGVYRRLAAAAQIVGWVGVLFVLVNPWLVGYLLPAGGAALLVRSGARRRAFGLAAGVGLLLLNPAFVRLPYIGLLTNEAVVISLFLPIGVLLGGAVSAMWERLTRVETRDERRETRDTAQLPPVSRSRRSAVASIAGAALLSAFALWGAWNMRDIVNPITVLATRADVKAIDWVTTHTPTDARFLINAAPWLTTAERGTDGGWWLLPLSGRWTSAPPVLYVYGPAEYVREVRARNQQVIGFREGQEQQIYRLIDRERITHIYLGPRPGPLRPAIFTAQEGFEKLYERDGVTIFAVHRSEND